MRQWIAVLGFFVLVLILIAGCTSTNNETSPGSNNQNPALGVTHVEGISPSPQSSPTECNLPSIDPIRFQKFLPDVPGYERKYGQTISVGQNYIKDTKYSDNKISELYQIPDYSKPYIISVIFVDRGSCITESVDEYIDSHEFDSNTTKINNFHGYPAIHDIRTNYNNLQNFYTIFINNRLYVLINFQGIPTKEYPLSKLSSEAEAELEKFASAIDFNAVALSI